MTTPRAQLALAFLVAAIAVAPAQADDYPRDLRVDVQHYRFALELTDTDDRITGEAQITRPRNGDLDF